MKSWEKRLRDLAIHLKHCGESYFQPDLFRMNTNSFLTTARTVTFIIQKNKNEIAGFDEWYQGSVVTPWSADPILRWAKDSRNQIEKIGDIELNSTVEIRLVTSYLEGEDVVLACDRSALIEGTLERLHAAAREQLSVQAAEAGFIRVERQWRANSLPDYELLNALVYVYTKIRSVVMELAKLQGAPIDRGVPSPLAVDALSSDARRTRYLPVRGTDLLKYNRSVQSFDPDFDPPKKLKDLETELGAVGKPQSISDVVEYYGRIARSTFEEYGNHVPMVFMFASDWSMMDFSTTTFSDRPSKLMFWRMMGDRVRSIQPVALLFISEAWERRLDRSEIEVSDMEIVGEVLQLFGIDRWGNCASRAWKISRDGESGAPSLLTIESPIAAANTKPNFLEPVVAAFGALGGSV